MASAGCFLRRKRPSTASDRSRPSASSAPSYTHSQRTISTAILLSRVNFVVHRSHSFYLNRSIIGHFLGISALRSLVRDSKRTYGRKVRSKTNRPVKFLRCENSRPTLFPPGYRTPRLFVQSLFPHRAFPVFTAAFSSVPVTLIWMYFSSSRSGIHLNI